MRIHEQKCTKPTRVVSDSLEDGAEPDKKGMHDTWKVKLFYISFFKHHVIRVTVHSGGHVSSGGGRHFRVAGGGGASQFARAPESAGSPIFMACPAYFSGMF